MKRALLIFSFFFLYIYGVTAQEEAVFNHYTNNPFMINPGATGFDADYHRIFFNFRSQWAGFPGSPKSYAGSYNGPIGNRLGLGAMVYAENIAELSRLRAQASYAYRYQIDKLSMGLGLSTELHRVEVNNDLLNDPFFEAGDALIMEKMDGLTAFDVTLGFFGTYDENTFFGVSLPNLIRNRLDEIAGTAEEGNSPIKYYTALVGHRFDLPENDITLEPSVAARKLRGAPLMIDLNLRATFLDEKLMGGATYTAGLDDAWFGFFLGTRLNSLQIMYSYHTYMGEFQSHSSGSHEISLGFFLPTGDGKYDRSRKYRN